MRRLILWLLPSVLFLGPLGAQEEILVDPATLAPPEFDYSAPGPGGSFRLDRIFRRQYGPVRLTPSIVYRMVYAEGVLSRLGEPISTMIHTVSPTLTATVGSAWTASYSPVWTFYANDKLEDNFGQSLSLSGAVRRPDWSVSVKHSTRLTSSPLVETGRQTEQQTHSTRIALTRRIRTKLNIESSLSQNLRYTEEYADMREFYSDNWLHYRAFPWATVSAGISPGYVKSNAVSDASMVRYSGQLNARLGSRLSVAVNGGVEERSLKDENTRDFRTPMYGASLSYQPTPHTWVTVRGDRSLSNSYFADQLARTTRWRASVTQRLLGRYFLTVDGSVRTSTYRATIEGITTTREDEGETFGVRLGTHYRTRGRISIYYTSTENRSNQRSFAFETDQYGLEFAYTF